MMLLMSCRNTQEEQYSADSQPRAYPVATVELGNVVLQAAYPAVLKGQEDVEIKPRVDGFIEAIYVDEGSAVHKGQPLFKVSSPSSIQALENARAAYNTAKIDVDRMRPLAEKGIISKVKITTYEYALQSAKASLDQAKALLGWTTVTSPVNGVVGTISYRLGSLVSNADILTTVANTASVVANFSINEKELYEFLRTWKGNSQAEKIESMPPVKLLLPDGSLYEESGRIQTISGIVDATSGAVNFRASFPNRKGLLRSGTSGTVVVPNTLKQVIAIPQRATFSLQDKILVYKVQGDSVVQKVVTVRPTPDGKSYAVTSGLTAGDKIVTDGVATLQNGQKIKVQQQKTQL